MMTLLDLGIEVLLTEDFELLTLVQRSHVNILSAKVWNSSNPHYFQVKGNAMTNES